MISELRLLFFASVIYFLVNFVGLFQKIDGVMKGQDELMIMFVKVTSTILILYLLIHFSKKQRIVEGNENISTLYQKLETAIVKKEGITLVNLFEKNKDSLIKSGAYGLLSSECNEKLRDKDQTDVASVIRCINLRILDNIDCEINELANTNECIIDIIMDTINVLSHGERKDSYQTINGEIEMDNKMRHKRGLSNTLDKLILLIHKGENYNNWIEYTLEIYEDLLLVQEKEYLRELLK